LWRKLIPRPAIEHLARALFDYSAPLLEEKRNIPMLALIPNFAHPVRVYGASAQSGFTANYNPFNSAKVKVRAVSRAMAPKTEI
jgi:hypothetical protein